jgi:hypothetical protein
MIGQLTYLLAQERVGDLQRGADHQRLVRATERAHPPRHKRRSLARLRGKLVVALASAARPGDAQGARHATRD